MTFKQTPMSAMDMIRIMGDRLANVEYQGQQARYPDLEQDAMRYWIARDLLCNFVQGDHEKLDAILDDKIKRILGA